MFWRSTAFLGRNALRIFASTIVLFAALPAKTEPEGPGAPNPENVLNTQTLRGTFARWMQPATATAAPRASTRYRKRGRGVKAQPKQPETASAQSAPVIQSITEPLTPHVQVWPSAPESAIAATGAATSEIVPVVVKTVRETSLPDPDETIVHANELSDIDLAAKPVRDSLALATTDGRAMLDPDESAPVNRFSAFAETVKSLPQEPWFDSVLLVMAGAIASFAAARMFLRA